MKVAIDLNGGDYSPEEVVEGIILAIKHNYILPDQILAFGNLDAINILKLRGLKNTSLRSINYRICSDIVGMGEKIKSFAKKRDSTIYEGIKSLKSGEAEAFISAGNTAAIVSLSVMILGRIKRGITPAIAVILPSISGHCLVVDVGANANSDAGDLLHNAVMGNAYAREILSLSKPRIGLLNIGEEIGKGHKDMHRAYDLLENSGLNFIGYIEGNDIFKGTVDVVVTDGFTGNILLKSSEGLAKMIIDLVHWELRNHKFFYLALPFLICAIPFFYPILKSLKLKLDCDEYGGALLMGVPGNIIIAHGNCKRKTIAKAIKAAVFEIEHGIGELIILDLLQYKKIPEA